MYIIVNNTLNKQTRIDGSFPLYYTKDLLDNGNDIIVISYYSNTIKIPYLSSEIDGIKEYEWNEYPLPSQNQ
jgi:predicted membrane-bound dolichyl-phosphate-mannose-protein mannosyltransferase